MRQFSLFEKAICDPIIKKNLRTRFKRSLNISKLRMFSNFAVIHRTYSLPDG